MKRSEGASSWEFVAGKLLATSSQLLSSGRLW